MTDPTTQSWREVVDGNPYYQRLPEDERLDAEARAKWTVAHMGKAGVVKCSDLAALVCEQALELEAVRGELLDLRQRVGAGA